MSESERAEFAALVRRPEEGLDLAAAALLLARIHEPVPDPARSLRLLDDYAAWLRLQGDLSAPPERAVRALGGYLAGELGFHGNRRDYYDPRNSCLNQVLERRTGIPITLAVVYLEVGWRLGLPLAGVGMPGHFLVKFPAGAGDILFDPFHDGAILTPEDCRRRLQEVYGRPVALEAHYLAAVTRKQILTRMLTNLKHVYLRTLDLRRALATSEHLLLISPWSLDEVRDRGLIHAQLGQVDRAVADLETYLQYAPDAVDAGSVQQRLERLRRLPDA